MRHGVQVGVVDLADKPGFIAVARKVFGQENDTGVGDSGAGGVVEDLGLLDAQAAQGA